MEVYGEEAMKGQHVEKWCHSFKASREDVKNYSKASSDCPSSLMTEINTIRVREMIQNH